MISTGGATAGRTGCSAAISAIGVDLEDDLVFGTVDAGTHLLRLEIHNLGTADLIVYRVARSAGSPTFEVIDPPVAPVSVAPGEHLDFMVCFAPVARGRRETATISIVSNSHSRPLFDLTTSGRLGRGRVGVRLDGGRFGEVCAGNHADSDLQVANLGSRPLSIFDITSTSPEFYLEPAPSFPRIIGAGDSIVLPLRCRPVGPGLKVAVLMVMSDDVHRPVKMRTVAAYARCAPGCLHGQPQPWPEEC